MPLIALLLLSSFAFADISISVNESDNGKEIIVKTDNVLTESSERVLVYEFLEVLAYDSCGGKDLFPELQLQEALPSENAFNSVRRVFRCEKLNKQSANWFKNFVKGSCNRDNLFPEMIKVCQKFRGKK